MLVQLTMRRKPPELLDSSPVEGIRILALLPEHWKKELWRATGDVVIRIRVNDGTTADQIRVEAGDVLTDPAIAHWGIVACHTVADGSGESKGTSR